MKRVSPGILGAALIAFTAGFVWMGGWAVVTVSKIPDAWIAGKPLQLSWQVRQHGEERLKGLKPTDIAGEQKDFGPDLSDRRFRAEYLVRYLADPSIKPATNGKRMPDLGLREKDIAPLVAFLNSNQRAVNR